MMLALKTEKEGDVEYFFTAKQKDLLWRLNLGVMKEIICGIEGVLHI